MLSVSYLTPVSFDFLTPARKACNQVARVMFNTVTCQCCRREEANPPQINAVVQTPPPRAISTCRKVWNFCTQGTILHALDNQRLEEETEANKKLSLCGKATLGIKYGLKGFFQKIPILILVSNILTKTTNLDDIQKIDIDFSFTESSVIVPILEEIVFRGIVQNIVAVSQRALNWCMPQCIKTNRVFIWIVSPSCRILVVNLLFAAVHLGNGGGYLTLLGAAVQVISILWSPRYSILHKTTGNIVAPIFAHMTNNAIAHVLTH